MHILIHDLVKIFNQYQVDKQYAQDNEDFSPLFHNIEVRNNNMVKEEEELIHHILLQLFPHLRMPFEAEQKPIIYNTKALPEDNLYRIYHCKVLMSDNIITRICFNLYHCCYFQPPMASCTHSSKVLFWFSLYVTDVL